MPIGNNIRWAIFYLDVEQKRTATEVIEQLKTLGCAVATQLLPVAIFWPAEEDHQDYYEKTGHAPYCHRYIRRF